MPHYELYYFDVRALAEPIRIIFALFDVPHEDHRVTNEQWDELKNDTPYGQLPVLKVDGFEIGQSSAIGRYLARKFGIAGQTPEEEAQADSIVDQYKDFIYFFRQFTSRTYYNEDPAEIKIVADTVVRPAAENYLAILKKVLANSKSGFLVGDSLTWADIVIADNLTSLLKNGFVDFEQEKQLGQFYEKIHAIPKIQEYVAKRKDTVV